MAKLLQAVVAYGPKIELMDAAEPQRFMELLTKGTTLSAGVVKNVQESEMETLVGLLKEGRPVCSLNTGCNAFALQAVAFSCMLADTWWKGEYVPARLADPPLPSQ